jgi:hypothetical protein
VTRDGQGSRVRGVIVSSELWIKERGREVVVSGDPTAFKGMAAS